MLTGTSNKLKSFCNKDIRCSSVHYSVWHTHLMVASDFYIWPILRSWNKYSYFLSHLLKNDWKIDILFSSLSSFNKMLCVYCSLRYNVISGYYIFIRWLRIALRWNKTFLGFYWWKFLCFTETGAWLLSFCLTNLNKIFKSNLSKSIPSFSV